MDESFEKSYANTMGIEKGYGNVSSDLGGETWMGISRNNWPNWEGWKIIDKMKPEPNFPKNLSSNNDLLESVKKFYYNNFWLKCKCDKICIFDENIALEVFDTSVNCGIKNSIKFLQEAINLLNNNGTKFKDITVDGTIGNETFSALSKIIQLNYTTYLFNWMNIIQGSYYKDLIKKIPSQEANARGWLKRIQITKIPV